ncbi:hypothetical protein [Vibrio algarum]|uniref:Teneurin-like YD-shell domain-containing protein n=1 Tax=Vibrio algarum TaxID=3020714 RepID=A0ABT4YSW0_9VIBR|nr:hypothetical protein [Vibrio sp. KJ40-1]MDB1124296.1 hypothetical protein [Vibrio sp. KJ40-1]
MSCRIWLIIVSTLAVALSFSAPIVAQEDAISSPESKALTSGESRYTPCRTARCGGGGGGSPDPGDNNGGDNNGGDGGNTGPSPSELDGDNIAAESKSFFERAFESIKSAVNRAIGKETTAEQATKEALAKNIKIQETDAANAKPGDETCKPVELYSGCKVTKVTDWTNSVLPINRVHRISQGSSWSLGAGWHASIDSRIIWGTDIDIGKQISQHQTVVADYHAIVEELDIAIDHLENGFSDRIGYNQSNAQAALKDGIAKLTAYKAQLLPKVQKAQSTLTTLASTKQQSDARRALNRYTVDASFSKEFEIGANLVKWIAPNGGRYLFIQDNKGSITAAAGHSNHFTHLSSGEVEIRTLNGETHRYNNKGLLTESRNHQGQSISLRYNSQNKPVSMTTELGHVLTLNYSENRLVSVKDGAGRTTRYHYQANLLQSVVQFDGKKQSYLYGYDSEPLAITSKTDGQKNSWSYDYQQQDGKAVVVTQTDAAGQQFSYQYDFLNDATVITHRNGSKTRYQYDENNKIISVVYGSDGSEINYIYDTKGNQLSAQNEVGDITRYSYNAKGEKLSITDGEGISTQFMRDGLGRVVTVIDGAGASTEYRYNGLGKVEAIEQADGSVITQTWQGQLMTSRIDESGNTTDYEYDANGYPTQITQYNNDTPSGDETIQRLSHDAVGRVNWVKIGSENTPDSKWRLTQYFYTAKDGRQLDKPTKIIDPLNRVALYEYNLNGLLSYQQDFSGVETFYTYTAMNKVASKNVVMPSPDLAEGPIEYHYRYQYDAENNLIEVSHPGDILWQYQYDERNRLTHSSIKGTEVVKQFSYDEAGRKLSEINSHGDSSQFDYYNNSQLKQHIDLLGNTKTYFYDNVGRLSQVSDNTRNSDISFERNVLGHLTERTDGNGNLVYITPNASGQVIAVSVPNNTEYRQSHQLDWRGKPLSTANALGGKVTYQYNAFGELIKQTTSAGATLTQDFDAIGRIISRTETSGLETTWQYTQYANRLEVVETQIDTLNIGLRGSKRLSTKTYDLMGRLVGYQDSAAQAWHFSYNLQGMLSKTTNPDGSTIARHYNKAGLLTQLTQSPSEDSPSTRHTYYQYDGEGRLIYERLPQHEEGYGKQYQRDAAGNITTITYADDSEVHYRYDEAGRKVEATYPNQLSERWEYDANDNLVSFIDRADAEWRYRYNADNQLVEFCDPVAGDAGCHAATRYQYDVMGNRTAHITSLGHTTQWQHNALGWVSTQTDPSKSVTRYSYDSVGRVTEITDPLGNKTEQGYTAFGELSHVTDPLNHKTQFYYDEAGRLIERKNSQSASDLWAYNYRNQVSQYTDALGNQTGYQYNAFGNLTQVNQPLDATIQYQWNNADQLTQVTEPMGGVQTFDYDERARLTQYTNQNGHQWQYKYDELGQLTTQYQPESGTDITYGYDNLGRKISEQFAHQGETQTNRWGYDAVGRLAQIENPYLKESYTYDADSQLIQSHNKTLDERFTYAFDDNGRRTQSQLGNNQTVQYQHDSKGRITKIIRKGKTRSGEDEKDLIFTLSYDKKDQLVRIDYPNNSRRWIGYDSEGRVKSIKIEQQWYTYRWENIWNTVELFEYRYDAAGNLTAENRKTKEAYYDQWAYFEYDQLNRVIEADYPLHYDNYYRWDKNGNLVYKKAKGLEYKYEYDKANQLTGYRGNYYLWYEVEHDANGNQTNEHFYGYTFDYQFNALGQLTGFDKWDNTKVRYGYDSRGRRVSTKRSMTHSKNWGAFEQHTAYDGRQEFAQWIKGQNKEKDEAFIPFRTLTLLPKTDEPYSSVLHQRLYDKHHRLTFAVGTLAADIDNLYIHSDRLDSSVHVLDKTGRSAMRLAYSALGRSYRKYDDVMSYYFDLEPLANYEFAQLMPYRYTGKFTDYSTGFVQMDSRWYNGHNGRFVHPDNWNLRNTHLPKAVQHELMQFTGVNTQMLLNDPSQQMAYGYVRGNPLKYVDPYGLYLNPFNRDTTQDITLSSISNDLSTISNIAVTGGLAAGGPTNPVGAGLLGFGGVAGGASVVAGGLDVVNDLFDGGAFNKSFMAGTTHAVTLNYIEEKLVDALPNKYEVPVRGIKTGVGVVSGALFSEASQNELRSDAKRWAGQEVNGQCGNNK